MYNSRYNLYKVVLKFEQKVEEKKSAFGMF